MDKGFIAAPGADGEAGKIVPEIDDAFARGETLIRAHAGDDAGIQLFRIVVAAGAGESVAEKAETFQSVLVLGAERAQLSVKGAAGERLRLVGVLFAE